MQIKVFKAETLKDAMAAMKAELGEDAVILHSRKYKKGGFFGFGGKEIIEITAAVEAVPLAERVRGIYKSPPKQTPLAELEGMGDENGDDVHSTFNDELPIDRPNKSPTFDETLRRTQSENEKLAETIRNAQNPTANETVDLDDESLPVDENLPPIDEQIPADENLPPIDEQIPVDENLPPIDEQLPADENLPPIDEQLPADENLPPIDEQLPADENLPPIDEQLPADENLPPIDEQLPVDENLPPIDEQLPVDENLPPIDEQLPVDENLPSIDQQIPVDENLPPIDEQLPVDENLPSIDQQIPVDENLPPIDEQIPVDENLPPIDEQLPVDENLPPIDEQLPVDENLPPIDEQLSVDENLPPIDEQLLHEQAAQFGFTPEQLAQAQAMMFAQFNQYQMAMAQMQMQAQAQAQAQVAEMAEQMRERHRRRLSTAGQAEAVKVARMTPEEKKIHNLENEVARMKNLLSGVMGRNASPNSVTLREALTYQEVDEDILDEMEMDASIGDTSADILSSAARLTLSNYIEEHLKFSGGIKLNRHGSRIVAVLGTTGVGKTTTLAKIAARFVLEHKIEPVLVTADTYRISAVDQLKTYSEILGLPLEIIYSPAELSATIDKHKDRELILIDTAGRSRQSFQQMQDLKDLLSVHSRIEKHLVLSATTKITDARDMIEKFAIVEPEKLIVTKVDETGTLGLILNLLKDRNLMLSYFTTGQGVPEDIEVANVNILTDLFMKKIVGE